MRAAPRTDDTDAAAAASVAAVAGDERPVAGKDLSSTRLINQLTAAARPRAGCRRHDLTAARATRVLAVVGPVGPVETMHKQVARELVGDVRVFDIRLEKLTRLIADTVADHCTRLPEGSHCEIPAAGATPCRDVDPATGADLRSPASQGFVDCFGRILLRVRENSDRPAATDRGGGNRPSYFERFVEAAHLWVSRPTFFFICLAVVLVWLLSFPLWTDLKEWQVAIHTVTSVTTLLLLALLENAARRSEESSQEKINMIAEALAALMTSPAVEDRDLEEAASKLREAIGLEERH